MTDYCATCPFKNRTRVNFDGPVDAKLAIIGEAPAMNEVRLGKPFMGAAGQLLDQFLAFFNIPREQIRVGNVLLCGPIDSDKEKLMKDPGPGGVGTMFEHALACCAERREAEGDLQSNVVLALGVSATWGLMGRRISLGGKRPHRGALFRDWKKRAIFPTWHPAMLLRAGGQGGDARPGKTSDAEAQAVANDLAKAWRFANGEQEEFKFARCDPKDTVQFCANARKAKKLIAVDVETDALDALTCNLTIVGIAVEDAEGIFVLSLWWPDTTPKQREAVRELLADPNIPVCLHNGAFDKTVLDRYDLAIAGPTRDTLLEHHVIAPECDHDLSSVVCNFLVTNAWKAEYYAREATRVRRGIKDIDDELDYNAGDAARTLAVAPCLDKECLDANLRHVADFDSKLSEVARWMRIWGIPVDTGVREEIGQALRQRVQETTERIHQMAIAAIEEGSHPVYIERFLKAIQKTKRLSLASPYQLAALMDLLEVPVPPGAVTPKGMRSTKNEIIATIGHPFTRTLVEYRSSEKLVSTFVDGIGLKLGRDGRIHPDWRIHAAVTGRWASQPMFLNWRKDLKDPSRNMRRMIVAPPGRKFVGADKCVVAGTRVQTKRGVIPIEEMTPHDFVVLEDGTLASVQALVRRSAMQVFEVETRAGYTLRCTAFHRIRVIDKYGKYVWRRVGLLEKSDCVAVQPVMRKCGEKRTRLPQVQHTHHSANVDVRVPPYLTTAIAQWFGFLVGNGYVPRKCVSWTVCGSDFDVQEGLFQIAQAFGIHLDTGYRKGAYWTRGSSVGLSRWLHVMGFSRTKLPPFLWTASAVIRGAFLRGLFEADGSAPLEREKQATVAVAMKQESLAQEVQQLLLTLGIFSTRFKTASGGYNKAGGWRVALPAFWLEHFQEQVGFISKRKQCRLDHLVHMAAHAHCNTKKAGMPNMGVAVRALHLTGMARKLLLNTSNARGSKVTPHIAAKLKKIAPTVYQQLELFRTAEYGTCFDQIRSVTKLGKQPVYDLSVPGPQTYLSNGFVSHNSQLEFRLIALVAGQEDLLEALSDTSRDVHSENAARLYSDVWPMLTANASKAKQRMGELEGLIASATNPLQRRQYETLCREAEKQYKETATSKKRLRELTKRATYASLYGSTAENLYIKLRSDEKLRDMGMEIEPEQCARFVQMFPQMWPKIEQWRRQIMLDAAAARESVSPILGRKRPFPLGRLDPTQAVNFPIQSAGADLVGMELLDLWTRLDLERDWIILQIHDAIVVETDEDRAEEVAALVTQTMTSEIELEGYKCLFPAEARIGKSWDQV